MREYPIEKFVRDAKITQICEGTNQIQRMVMEERWSKRARGCDTRFPHRKACRRLELLTLYLRFARATVLVQAE